MISHIKRNTYNPFSCYFTCLGLTESRAIHWCLQFSESVCYDRKLRPCLPFG